MKFHKLKFQIKEKLYDNIKPLPTPALNIAKHYLILKRDNRLNRKSNPEQVKK